MQNNQVQVFESKEFGKIEVMMIDGQPYFPAAECAVLLGYSRPHNAVERHCRYSLKRGVPHPQSASKEIEKIYIPEGDLYRLIIRSKLPAAIRFESFVCDEVLPSIRRHGAYITPDVLERMREDSGYTKELLNLLAAAKSENRALVKYVDELQPKAQYYNTVLQTPYTVPVTLVSKGYGMTAMAFNRLLHNLGIQYPAGNTWVVYPKYANRGYTVTQTYLVNGERIPVHTQWTQAGQRFLYTYLARHGILPNVHAQTGA